MTPLETARAAAAAIGQFASLFMLDPATYARGADLGFEGMDFYFAGRCGVLGPVDADVVSAALVFFNPTTVRPAWERGLSVMAPAAATEAFVACASAWSARIPDDVDVVRLAELARRVIVAASPAGAPLFAGWRALAEPEDPKALALVRMNVLRELRGNLHGAAVLASGLRPLDALMVRTPSMAGLFGWTEEDLSDAVAEPARPQWTRAEEMTDVMLAPAFATLTEDERDEFVARATAAWKRAAAA